MWLKRATLLIKEVDIRNSKYYSLKRVLYQLNKGVGMKAFCAEKCLAGGDPCFWLNLVKQGKFKEAWQEIVKLNPLPAVIGRVCPHPCEDVCKRVLLDEPISINALEGYLGELALANGWHPRVLVKKVKPFRVAVVGSGPAGLSCAYQLARRGYKVTIYEELPLVGGMLRAGIPDFRLPKNILSLEMANNIFSLGVEVRTNYRVDQKLFELLQKEFRAVFVAIGLQKSRRLNIPGEDLPDILYGLEFLKDVNLGKKVKLGKKVIVIGGGNTAIDVARTARRLGSQVTIFYRRTKAEMPAIETEVAAAESEGIKIQELVLPVRIFHKALEFQRAKLGEPEGSNFQEEFDNLIIAAGEELDESLGLESETRGTVAEVIKLGREAAEKIVQPSESIESKTKETRISLPGDSDFYLTPKNRIEILSPALAEKEAKRCLGCGFEKEGLAEVLIDQERCKGCGLCVETCPYQILGLADHFNSYGYLPAFAKNSRKCWGCTWCTLICPDVAIEIKGRRKNG